MLCRAVTIAAGSADSAPIETAPSSASGKGSSHGTSGRAASSGPAGSLDGPPRPAGNGRRLRFSSARRQVFVAIRYSQVRRDARPSNSP